MFSILSRFIRNSAVSKHAARRLSRKIRWG
jgi:hypothetical protein